MNNERFMVPEVLFNPSDIGLQQMGIPEAIALGRQSEKKMAFKRSQCFGSNYLINIHTSFSFIVIEIFLNTLKVLPHYYTSKVKSLETSASTIRRTICQFKALQEALVLLISKCRVFWNFPKVDPHQEQIVRWMHSLPGYFKFSRKFISRKMSDPPFRDQLTECFHMETTEIHVTLSLFFLL